MIRLVPGSYPFAGAVVMSLVFLAANAVRSIEADMEQRTRPKRSLSSWLLFSAVIGVYAGFAMQYAAGPTQW